MGLLKKEDRTKLMGLQWFKNYNAWGSYFDFEHWIEKRMEDGTHDWQANYPGIQVVVYDLGDRITLTWMYVTETPDAEIAYIDPSEISPEDLKTLNEFKDRIIENIKDALLQANIILTVLEE